MGVQDISSPVPVPVFARRLPRRRHKLSDPLGASRTLCLGVPPRLLGDLSGDRSRGDLGADRTRPRHVGLILSRDTNRHSPTGCRLFLLLAVLASATGSEDQRHGQSRDHQKRPNDQLPTFHRLIPSPRPRARWGMCVGLPPPPPPSDDPGLPGTCCGVAAATIALILAGSKPAVRCPSEVSIIGA